MVDVICAAFALRLAFFKHFSGNDEVSYVVDGAPVCDGKRVVRYRIGDGAPDSDIYDADALGG